MHVERVRHLGGYRLEIVFSNGCVKEVDLGNELHGEVFLPLKDLTLFERATVNPETGTVEWPNGADFAPEFLYELGKQVRHAA